MKRDEPISDRLKALADCFIKEAGSKRAAHRAIDAAETKGEAGRPDGTQKYLKADLALLFQADLLQTEYRLDQKRSRPLATDEPKRRSLLAQVAPENTKESGLGKSKDAVVARVAKRGSLAKLLLETIRQNRPDLMRLLPDDADARLRSIESDPYKMNLGTILWLFMAAVAMQDPDRWAKEVSAKDTENPAPLDLVASKTNRAATVFRSRQKY